MMRRPTTEKRLARLERKVAYLESSSAFRMMRVLALPVAGARMIGRKLLGKPSRQTELTLDARHLKRANEATSDKAWLEAFNEYLHHHNLYPIRLSDGHGDRFVRFVPRQPHNADGPLVSVIMAAYNAEATIDQALRSLLASTWSNIEVIVVDDASSDRTAEIVEGIVAADARVRFFQNPINVGPYVSKNRALELVCGDFFTGHDADDWALPEGIEKQMLSMRDGVDASVAEMVRVDANGIVELKGHVVRRQACVSGLFRTSVFREKLGHYDPVRYAADSEILGRAQAVLGPAFVRDTTLRMICLNHGGSLTNAEATGHATSGRNRRFYRESYREWHQSLNGSGYIEAEHWPRSFAAPSDMLALESSRFQA